MIRVRFAHPDAGYPADQLLAREHLTVGAVYQVLFVDVHPFRTEYYLEGKPDRAFNSVLFEEVA